jgi:hypothetical protein
LKLNLPSTTRNNNSYTSSPIKTIEKLMPMSKSILESNLKLPSTKQKDLKDVNKMRNYLEIPLNIEDVDQKLVQSTKL